MTRPTPLSLIDIGANLADKAFGSDRDEVIARALAAGVTRMIVTGPTVEDSELALRIAAARFGTLHSTAGVHPHYAKHCNDTSIDRLRNLATKKPVVAVGECGLDFYRDISPRKTQVEWFERQIELAVEVQKPLFLHDRDAFATMEPILREHRDRFTKAVVHCFTGDAVALRAYLDLDLHIGITGWICDERRGLPLRDLVAGIPRDRLMIETDAPYLLPRTVTPHPRSRRNEPMYLPWVLKAVASAIGAPQEEIAESTRRTAEEFFGIG